MYTGAICERGKAVEVLGYKKFETTLYYAGSKKTVQGYSEYGGDLYMAGSATNKVGTAHSSGTYYKGDGAAGYLRGDSVSVTKQGGAIPYTLYISTGGVYRQLGQTGYYGGSSETFYRGNGSYVTGRGTAVDAIAYKGTLYEKGAEITPTSTKISGLYRQDDEENWTYTPIGTSMSGLYQRFEEDDFTAYESGKTLTHNLATVTTREVTALTV